MSDKYRAAIESCNDLQTLFDLWKNKPPRIVDFQDKNTKKRFEINHKDTVFISDGVVNPLVWGRQTPRILFVMKEAYSNKDDEDWSLANWVATGDCLKHKIWRRIALWTNGLLHTTSGIICPYTKRYSEEEFKDSLQRIAILNIKKSNGKSVSDYDELDAYASEDMYEIRKEFELIDPDVVVCGGCFLTLYATAFARDDVSEKNENWYYYRDVFGKERLFLDFYHPANHWSELLNYYGLMGIYQQALISKCTGGASHEV